MRTRTRGPSCLALILAVCSATACQGRKPPGPEIAGPSAKFPDPTEKEKPRESPVRDEIPAAELESVMSAHLQGLGHMERYEYDQAAEAFREVHERAPGWIPGSINLAVALLNQSGTQEESSGKAARPANAGPSRAATPPDRFQQALGLLEGVLGRDPGNLHAHYTRGIILEYLGRLPEAHRDFVYVAEHDPTDAHAWYKVGSTLADAEDPSRPAGPRQAGQLIEVYTKALERNPYLVSALYKLQSAYAWAGDRARQKEVLGLWQRLNPKSNVAGPGETAETFYGEMGRYAGIIDPISAPGRASEPGLPPRFGAPSAISVSLPPGSHWVEAADFQGRDAVLGRARARFGAAVATFDADGDGRLDLYLAAAVRSPEGIRDALLLNRGQGRFEDATLEFGLPTSRASLGVAAADYDADRRVDLLLTGVGPNRLYHNLGKRFEDVTEAAGVAGPSGLSLTARWLDLDQDGDLDLYVVNYSDKAHADAAFAGKTTQGIANSAFRNVGKAAAIPGRPPDNWAPLAVAPEDLHATAGLSTAFATWPDPEALLGGPAPHTGLAALDVDEDRDIDLILSADGEAPRVVLNDRLGRFHSEAAPALSSNGVTGLLVTDLDKDGRPDLVEVGGPGPVRSWRNTTGKAAASRAIAWEPWPTSARGWRTAQAADLDLDTWYDLVGLRQEGGPPGLAWMRNDGERLSDAPLALAPDESRGGRPVVGFTVANVVGDPLPDLIEVCDGAPPRVARNLGNGNHWLALDLSGRWKASFDHMRSNPHGLGTRLTLEGQGLHVVYDHTTPDAGLAQSVAPFVLGLGKIPTASLLRLRWPDGTMQSELNVVGDKVLALAEHNRKTGSCPVLFTWNGDRFVCVGDFLGGGGLGYLVAPGVFGEPDRDESVAIAPEQLREEKGAYRLAIAEPMDEVAYLDRLTLDVVDRPPGVSAVPDERFMPEGLRPTGALIAWREEIEPVRVTDLEGRDLGERLRAWDRLTADGFPRLRGWIGYAEEHGIVLDFGERLSRLPRDAPLTLCLAGWVEYPYSQTNYAAATAGVVLKPPSVERRRGDGTWELIVANSGYPAGLPRMTTLDLSGKLAGPSCTIRLRTNMECYWDRAFLALRDPQAGLRVTSLPVARASLGERGYLREVSPDGRLPFLYDYEHVDPAPLARFSGRLTRFGDVAPLLREDDDQLCLVGPGDEVRLEFDAGAIPRLREGWTRGYVLRAVGYCKDADPFTAASDSVGPLPWRGMPAYPFGPEGERPRDVAYRAYLRDYQTRSAGGD